MNSQYSGAPLAKKAGSRNNSFGFFRFVAASGVIFSHHFAIYGFPEPKFASVTIGTASVYLFFVMSGYLIYQSIRRHPDPYRFVSARILRIVPNLFAVMAATSALLLVYYSNYSELFEHLRYVVQNIFMLLRGGPRYEIPGIWEEHPLSAINGSIWSLPYEVWCYGILFVACAIAGQRQKFVLILLTVACVTLVAFPAVRLWPLAIDSRHLGILGAWFFGGASLAAFCWSLPLISSARMAWFDKGGDPSYGMYICAFPVQQACYAAISNFWLSMTAAFVITVAIGYTTWHLYEQRFLQMIDALSFRLRWLAGRLLRKSVGS